MPLPPVSDKTAAWLAWLWHLVRWLATAVATIVPLWTAAALSKTAGAPMPPWWVVVLVTPAAGWLASGKPLTLSPWPSDPQPPPTSGPAKALLLAFMLGVGSAGCANPIVTAYRGTAAGLATARLARDTLHEVCHIKRVRCLEVNAVGSPGYETCWAECRKAEQHWVTYGRPAVNSAVAATIAAIQAAELAQKKPNWLEIAKPLACAMALSLKQWGHLLPPSVQSQARVLADLAAGATCKPVEVP